MSDARPLRFAVIGSPIAHSRSPAMHLAAFAALGLPHGYEAIRVAPWELGHRMDELRRGVFAGFNVTIPHKTAVLDHVDELHVSARGAGAANTIVRTPEGSLVAHNTDTPALAKELRVLAGGRLPFGATGLVLGTGGAARAAVLALGGLGFRRVILRGRSLSHERERAALAEDFAARLDAIESRATVACEPLEAPAAEDKSLAAIVQATSAGMEGADPGEAVAGAVSWTTVPPSAVALDVVYAPTDTPFLRACAARGLRAEHGLGMLARQGALAFELWTGLEAPFERMLEAARTGRV
ncbi:MAG: shikimate dehydrogenase [Myxococcales bacterium]|nr:shikimate dehydrogenase [Myxococcales bacterium]